MGFLFIEDEEDNLKKTDISENKKEPISKITQKEVYEDLYERAHRKRKIKTSIFSKLDTDILNNLSELIITKKMSYRVALEKLKALYPDIPDLQTKRHESLRYFLIKHNFIHNEKALKTINKSISNSTYAKNKRDRIIEDVIEDIFNKHFDKLLSHPKFNILLETKIKEFIK